MYRVVSSNLDAIYKARQAFIANENSEKIRRALSRNIRTSGEIKHTTGNFLYYKHMDSDELHGPAKVIGQDGQRVLVKNGSKYPCCLQLIHKKM